MTGPVHCHVPAWRGWRRSRVRARRRLRCFAFAVRGATEGQLALFRSLQGPELRAAAGRSSRCSPRPLSARVGPTGTELQLCKKAVVLSVRADPEPGDLLILQKPKGTVPECHADRVNGVAIVNLLEVKARVPSVVAEQPIRLPSEVPGFRWQLAIRRPEARRRARSHSLSGSSSVALPAARSARASAASLLRASCEVANWRAQCSSSRSSSSSHWAIRSCSSAGSVASFAMTASSARVIKYSIPFAATRPNPAVHRTGARVARSCR
jgi:hypothetical protein